MSTAIDTALQAKTIMPSLTVDDLPASVRFFEGLGFAVEQRWEDNGTLQGVMLRAGQAQIGLSQDDWKKGRDRKKGVGTRIIIETAQNIDELATRAKQAGVKLNAEPHDAEEGGRAFEVTEPSGFLLTIWSQA
jgi:predicted enzyme related to lactoylglutathione lyase